MACVHTVLVTGFETFGPHARNPTQGAVALLPEVVAGARVVTGVLPVEYGRCGEAALSLIADWAPDAVLLTGLAAGRRAVTLERIAINVRDCDGSEGSADNAGYAPRDAPVIEGGPDGLFATLPNRAIVEALGAAGIPAEVSNTAGTFICNETLYAVLASLSQPHGPYRPAGFMHVPDVDIIPLASTVRAIRIAIEVVGHHLSTR